MGDRVWHGGEAYQNKTLQNTYFPLRGFTTVANCFKTEVKWRELSSFAVSFVYYGRFQHTPLPLPLPPQ